MTFPTYGLIGRGRLAAHLAHYLALENRSVRVWNRGSEDRVDEALGDADVVLLAISDDALELFIDDNPALRDRPIAHFSGSKTVGGAHGLHPLMTFGPKLYALETYRSIPFVTDRGGASFGEVFPGLENPSWVLDPELKPLYHALCVLAGNFTTIAWTKAMEDFESRLGLPRRVLRPLLEQTAANTLADGRAALTGSLARGEKGTIDLDLEGLHGDPYREVYLAYVRAHAARETGA